VIGAILTIVGFAAFASIPATSCRSSSACSSGRSPSPGARPTLDHARRVVRDHARADRGTLRLALGIVAGIVHSSAAMSVGWLHAGLNLYNNGFAAGIVASVLAPVIIAVPGAHAPPRRARGRPGRPAGPLR